MKSIKIKQNNNFSCCEIEKNKEHASQKWMNDHGRGRNVWGKCNDD